MKASTLYYIALLLFGVKMFSQSNPSIKTDLPQIAPPSPTVAALMKFEEVPVNNYTGIPDISIPLYSVQSHSKDIGVNLSLKYHPGSIAVEEEAGYTGLGWSLMGGGTISRTVRGCPDDLVDNGNMRYGIHYDTSINANPFYEVVAINALPFAPSSTQEYTRNKFYWEAFEKGKYDTQHDLYQFNFMGHQGRFYIKKTGTNLYEVVRLDNNNAIKVTYDGVAKTFTVFDDKGYKYIFDIREVTTESIIVGNKYFGSDITAIAPGSINQSYISAFQISRIYDTNNNLLIEFKYNTSSEEIIESTNDVMTTTSYFHSTTTGSALAQLNNSQCSGNAQKIEPAQSSQVSTRYTKTKKVKRIQIIDKALIRFTLTDGSEDPDGPQVHRLKHITVHPWSDSTAVVKRFELFYDYSQINYGVNPKQRLMLTKVSEKESSGPKTQSYELFYTQPQPNLTYTKDHWGYFNQRPANNTVLGQYREATPGVCEIDALQKMRLPSGGAIVFNFESNTYSHIGSTALTNFDENPENWTYINQTLFFIPGRLQVNIPAATYDRYATFTPWSVEAGGQRGTFSMSKLVNGVWESAGNVNCTPNDGTCTTSEMLLEANVTYRITFNWLNMTVPADGNVKINFKYRNDKNYQFLFGGGIRIKEIGYFEDGEVPQWAYDNPTGHDYKPAKQKNYSYNFFGNGLKSSGSLVFPKPIYDYIHTKKYYMRCLTGIGLPTGSHYEFTFRTVNSYNNLKASKTQGSDVGYKNVTVSETGNGYSRFEYKSPIDEPEANYSTTFPFLPNINYDHRRGMVTNEEHYREDGNRLTETVYTYAIDEGKEKTGFILSALNNCKYAHLYENYSAYGQGLDGCAGSSDICYACGVAINYINPFVVEEAFGWVKLTKKTTKEYFYTSANTAQGTVETKETYTYNSLNKKIASVTTETYTGGSTPETVSQEFGYLYDAALLPTNKISEIERVVSKKDGAITGAQKIVYANTYPGNTAWLPGTIQAAKESSVSMENRVQFVKYDTWSNPLEVKLENGTPVSYIWGYNKTQPIAMIENATYEQLATALGTSVANIRDNYSEANLGAINGLRTSMATAMVTTYTYRPLVGVETVTDPKGAVTTYEYDPMGRLKAVKDRDGNLLSENEYHYRMP